MERLRRAATPLLALVICLLVAGCGGGTGDETNDLGKQSEPDSVHSEWLVKADQQCADELTEVGSEGFEIGFESSSGELLPLASPTRVERGGEVVVSIVNTSERIQPVSVPAVVPTDVSKLDFKHRELMVAPGEVGGCWVLTVPAEAGEASVYWGETGSGEEVHDLWGVLTMLVGETGKFSKCGHYENNAVNTHVLVGLEMGKASNLAGRAGCTIRVTEVDGIGQPVTDDLIDTRINVAVEDGHVVAVFDIE